MSNQITILVGTMTGTAELVAQDVEPELQNAGFDVEIIDMDGLDIDVFERPGLFLICTSTYGQGEVPDNAVDFYEKIQSSKPDLSHIKFGVIGLGDSTYSDTYNFGGERFEKALTDCGAGQIGQRMKHNASSDELAEEMAITWIADWIPLAQTAQ